MSMSIRIEAHLYDRAKREAAIEHRTIAGQVEYWAKVGRAAIDNPDLPIYFILDLLASMSEPASERTPYIPGSFDWTLSPIDSVNYLIVKSRRFLRSVKRLHPNVMGEIHKAISQISTEPEIGEKKKNEFEFFLVYKFWVPDIQYLLAYTIDVEREQIVLTAVGPHENFYRNLKR